MDLSSHAYTLLDLAAAGVIGFVFGRITAGRNDPRRQEEKKRQAQDYDREIRALASKLSPAASTAARRHAQNGELIQAVKLVREDLGCGLKEAKDVAERLGSKS